jgi:hypothetical protein
MLPAEGCPPASPVNTVIIVMLFYPISLNMEGKP